eukprot:362917-Chlamydomonas_euryale.AAC.2
MRTEHSDNICELLLLLLLLSGATHVRPGRSYWPMPQNSTVLIPLLPPHHVHGTALGARITAYVAASTGYAPAGCPNYGPAIGCAPAGCSKALTRHWLCPCRMIQSIDPPADAD